MDKLKLLNIFILTFAVTLLIQMWLMPKKDATPVAQ